MNDERSEELTASWYEQRYSEHSVVDMDGKVDLADLDTGGIRRNGNVG